VVQKKEFGLKSFAVERGLGLLGLLLLGALYGGASRWRLDGQDLARLYQSGYALNTLRLLEISTASPMEREVLRRRVERARTVSAHDPERLRAVAPYPLQDDGRFWPLLGGATPAARWRLRWNGNPGEGELVLQPLKGSAWRVPLRSKGLVRPDWSAFSRLVAFYDLGRVWIADVDGKKFQSLVQEPELDRGGVLKFSADGTALAFYFHNDRTWLSQDLYVLVER
jgi:hypothetical protein